MKPELLALKRAFEETVKGVGGLDPAERYCRVGKSVLAEGYSPHHPNRFPAIDVVADLEPLARDREGWPHVTRALCTLMGGTFVPLPQGPVEGIDLLGSLARLSKEFSDISQEIIGGLSDGVFSKGDATQSRQQVHEAQAVLAAMDAQLSTIEGGE